MTRSQDGTNAKALRDVEEKQEIIRQYEEQANRAKTLTDDWHGKWVFSLSVGNGASLISVAGAILQKYDPRLLPSAWLFLVGLIAAGMLPMVLNHRHSTAWDFWRSKADREKKNFRITEGGVEFSADDYIDLKRSRMKAYSRLETILVALSSASFILAMALGLFSLTNLKPS